MTNTSINASNISCTSKNSKRINYPNKKGGNMYQKYLFHYLFSLNYRLIKFLIMNFPYFFFF